MKTLLSFSGPHSLLITEKGWHALGHSSWGVTFVCWSECQCLIPPLPPFTLLLFISSRLCFYFSYSKTTMQGPFTRLDGRHALSSFFSLMECWISSALFWVSGCLQFGEGINVFHYFLRASLCSSVSISPGLFGYPFDICFLSEYFRNYKLVALWVNMCSCV